MPKAFPKHKLLFDENMPPRQRYRRLNQHFDVKHAKLDFHMAGDPDEAIYAVACEQGRIIITINRDDFKPLVGTKRDAGVIAIPDGQAAIRTDTKLTALLMRHGPKYFQGRIIALGGEDAK
jgi:predicted nuclease of predicted toxin-antitoxin system